MTGNDSISRYLRTSEAARMLGLSARTLEKHRTYGTGPVYRKLGGRIVYAPEDLRAWADRGVRRSTSDPGIGIVYPAKQRDPNTPPATRPKRPRAKPKKPKRR
jgi:predicted DNA-binding transcriptional regulator AlpA